MLINLSLRRSYPGFKVIVSLVHNFPFLHFTAYLLGFCEAICSHIKPIYSLKCLTFDLPATAFRSQKKSL